MDCKNCGTMLQGKFCHGCGQKDNAGQDKSLKGILHEAFHFMTHFEGTFFKTFTTILLKPAKLSLDYCNGIRKKYYKPISFFLLLILIYLLFPVAEGLNQRLGFYKGQLPYWRLVERQIEQTMLTENLTFNELEVLFRVKSEKTSKFMMPLLIPLTALAFYFLNLKKKYKAFDYAIVATEFTSYSILTMFLLSPLITYLILGRKVGDSLPLVIILMLLVCYSAFNIFRIFFRDKIWVSALKTLLFLAMMAVIVQEIYKFLLFQVTIALI